MAETYCGKTCAECAKKETLNCPGCKAGPGRQFGGDCELARCVRNKSHETCDTCSLRVNCGTLRGRDSIPEYRIRRIEAEEQRKAAIAGRAPVLGKWLWILFWLIIPNEIAGLMTHEMAVEMVPALYIPGMILDVTVLTVYGVILLKLASEEERYRTAGICSLIANAASILIAVVSGGGETPTWTLLISLPASAASFFGVYNECMAHSAVLTGVDNLLAEKWEKLWKWYIGLLCAMIGGIVVMLILPLLGVIAMLVSVIGTAVVGIVKLVYLYRTAQIFRNYPACA
ncbi:MAG: DUF3795 domain-containing protein [Oscillospiraceae bacterium]|nr:DUF3795 domain-containing protein [Oscillospiraceae bacterium]